MGNDIETTWRTLRKFIYYTILQQDTTPKECLGLFKLSYYEVIIRPIIKTLNSEFYMDKPEEFKEILQATKNSIKTWTHVDQNIGLNLKSFINSIISPENNLIDLQQFDKLRIEDVWKRIIRGEENNEIKKNFILPTVLKYLSNAKMHELESRFERLRIIDDDRRREKEIHELKIIIQEYTVSIEYNENYKNQTNRTISDNWENAYKDMTIEELEIIQRISKLQNFKQNAIKYYGEIEDDILNGNLSNNQRLKYNTTTKILRSFKESINNANDQTIWDIERIIDEKLLEDKFEPDHKKESLKTVGRPKMIKEKKDLRNSTILNYYKKEKS